MAIPKNADLGVVVNHLRDIGIGVTKSMKKLLEYFRNHYVITHSPSGFGCVDGGYPDIYEFVAKRTGMRRATVCGATHQLEGCGVLGTQKGVKSPGGREWEYGFTPIVTGLYH